MRIFKGKSDLLSGVGEHLGTSDWHEIDQRRIDKFADTTGDHQWIHVDPDRAAEESPFGATVAHGLLTLSMHPVLGYDNYRIEGARMGVNYGYNKIRFIAPVTAGSFIRLSTTLTDAVEVTPGTVSATLAHTIEIRDNKKPALVAEGISRYIF